MERNYLICVLLGKYIALKPDSTSDDLRYHIDEQLQRCCLPLLGAESGDNVLLQELTGEIMIYVLGQGINRKQRRLKH